MTMAIKKLQRSRLTFQPRRSYWSPINIFKKVFSEIIGPIELKFHMKISYNKLAKIYANWFGHMTKMADMPIYGKNLLLQNQKADDLGTWYVTFGMWGLPSLFK